MTITIIIGLSLISDSPVHGNSFAFQIAITKIRNHWLLKKWLASDYDDYLLEGDPLEEPLRAIIPRGRGIRQKFAKLCKKFAKFGKKKVCTRGKSLLELWVTTFLPN